MAGTLFRAGAFTKSVQTFAKDVSLLFPNRNGCGVHFQQKGAVSASMTTKQLLHQSGCSRVPKKVTHECSQKVARCSVLRSSAQTVNMNSKSHLQSHGYVTPGLIYIPSSSCTQVRHKSTGKQQDTDDADDSDEDDALDPDDFDAPPKFKVMKITAPSTRVDAIVSQALDVGRNHLDEIFLKSGLFLNGKKLLKKAAKMDEGDYADLLVEKDEDLLKVKRVKVLKIFPEKTNKDRVVLKVRVWKAPFYLGKPEFVPKDS